MSANPIYTGFTEKVSRLVGVHIMGASPDTEFIPAYADNLYFAFLMQEELAKQGGIDAYCNNLECTGNRMFVNEPMPNCNPSRVIEWLLIKATPLQRCLAALAAVGYEIEPLLDEGEYPQLRRQRK